MSGLLVSTPPDSSGDVGPIDLAPERFKTGVPYDDFRRLRVVAPVWWSEPMDCWVVTSYELVEQCNRDWQRFSSSDGVVDPEDAGAPRWKPITALDPPEHSRQRRLVMPPFTPGPIGRLEPMVRETARQAIAEIVESGGGDFVSGVAAAVPFRVMAALTGVPVEDEALIGGWINAVMPSTDPEYRSTPLTAETARRDLGEYCLAVVRSQRNGERAPLAAPLFEATLDGRRLTDQEIANFVDTFLVGGTETTRQLLTHGLVALLEHPEQREELVGAVHGAADGADNSSTVALLSPASAVEEVLRWASPVVHHARRATEDTVVGSVTVRAGDRVTLWIASANRDEAVFPDPDRFDITRTPNPHVALGAGGPHHCLGAHLARLEGRVVLQELIPWLGRLALVEPPVRVASNFFNGIKRCRVTLDPS